MSHQIPDLHTTPQWIAWRYVPAPGKVKPSKVPFSPKGSTRNPRRASVVNPATWGTYAQAQAFAQAAGMAGIGLVLTADLGLTLIDLDNCIDGAGSLAPWAAEVVSKLDSYTELSPSGRGLHILAWGAVPALKTDRIELYSDQRYTTVTGKPYGAARPIRHAQQALDSLRSEYAPTAPPPVEKVVHPSAMGSVDPDDSKVISVLLSVPRYAAAWHGAGAGDRSRQLFSLCNGLVWLCGDDPLRIERIIRYSTIYDPERHEKNAGGGHSNLQVSIHNAINTWHGTPYRWPAATTTTPTATVDAAPAAEPLTLAEQVRRARNALALAGLGNSDLAVADSLLDLIIERGRDHGLAISLAKLRAMAGLGSTSTVRSVLNRTPWIKRISAGDKITRSDVYDVDLNECTKSHGSNTDPKTSCDFVHSLNFYSAHRSADIFSTGWGAAGVALSNDLPGLGKLVALLIAILQGAGREMTVKELAGVVNRNAQTVRRALCYAVHWGLLDRRIEPLNGKRWRYLYSVPGDVSQRAALATLDAKTYGAGAERAANAAMGLVVHADRLLNPSADKSPLVARQRTIEAGRAALATERQAAVNEDQRRALDAKRVRLDEDQSTLDNQRATLAAWKTLGLAEFKGLRHIIDLAGRIDKQAVRAVIMAATPENRNSRAIQAAKQFVRSIRPDAKITAKQAHRLFRHWAALNGYHDLAGHDTLTFVALKTALRLRLEQASTATTPVEMFEALPEPKRLEFGDFAAIKAAEQLAAVGLRFGFTVEATA